MKKIRIGIIIDNPKRDLEHMTLVSCKLAKKGFMVFMIPMYKQRYFISRYRLDLILLNYLRFNNINSFIDYINLGTSVAVLDTEGTAGKDEFEFIKFISGTRYTNLIDLYLFWGSKQLEIARKYLKIDNRRLISTGSPKIDILIKPWVETLKKTQINPGFILINTNFPLVNPKFSFKKKDELKNLIKVGFDVETAQSIISDNLKSFQGMISFIKFISIKVSKEFFVVRPHPFENPDIYRSLFNNFKNIKIVHEGAANYWIKNSKCLLHVNCSTAIESVILGKKAFSLEWLNSKYTFRPLPTEVSHKIFNQNEIFEILSKNLYKSTSKLNQDISNFICNSFGYLDGKNSQRVADAIDNFIKSNFYKNKQKKIKISLLKKIKRNLNNMMEYNYLWKIKNIIKNYKSDKQFDKKEVDKIINRFSIVEASFKTIESQNFHRSKYDHYPSSDIVAVIIND